MKHVSSRLMSTTEEPRFVHAVYFTLVDSSNGATESLIKSARTHLDQHEGCIFFSVGPRDETRQREVNDLDFHVALTIVFESQAAHDKYQVAPQHLKFIETQSANWSAVRVFDALA